MNAELTAQDQRRNKTPLDCLLNDENDNDLSQHHWTASNQTDCQCRKHGQKAAQIRYKIENARNDSKSDTIAQANNLEENNKHQSYNDSNCHLTSHIVSQLAVDIRHHLTKRFSEFSRQKLGHIAFQIFPVSQQIKKDKWHDDNCHNDLRSCTN